MGKTSDGAGMPSIKAMRKRLDEALGDARMQSGTLAAHALHDLFLAEVRQQGWDAAEQGWRELDAATIGEIAREFQRLVGWDAGPDYALPAGAMVISYMAGCAIVGSESLGFDVERPGLHDISDLPTRVGGPNLARLFRYIDELTRELPCRAIGTPRLVDRSCGRHLERSLQFPPFAPAGHVVLQHGMDMASWGEFFCAFSDEMVSELAADIVKDMRKLWNDHQDIAQRVRSARNAATAVASKLREVRVHAVTINFSTRFSHSRLLAGEFGGQLAIEFDAWDHAYRRGLIVQQFSTVPKNEVELNEAELDRASAVAAVHALGADGWVDVLARAILVAAPRGAAAVLDDLADNLETLVTLPTSTGPLLLRMHWWNGEIRAETREDHMINVSGRHVTLKGQALPDTLIESLRRQPLTALFDQPFRCEARIAGIGSNGENLVVTPEPDPWLVNCRTGRMSPEA